MGKNSRNPLLGIVVLVVVLGLAAWRLMAPWMQADRCDLSSGTCQVVLAGQPFDVELIPRRPASGEALLLVLKPVAATSQQVALEDVSAHFSMPGMDMGEQVARLVATEAGVFEGRHTLPTCPLGQSLWRVSIRDRSTDDSTGDLVLHVGE